jgi:membrane-bound lytic murein transglycosylase D
MRKHAPRAAHRETSDRSPAVALGVLAFSLLLPAGGPPALAERLDLGLQPFQAAAFDDAALAPASADRREADPPLPAGADMPDVNTPDAAVTPEEPGADVADAEAGGAADETETASDTDPPDGGTPAETDTQETELVAESEPADAADEAEPADLETAAIGELPEPQPPQLLWRFKTLFTRRDNADDPQDTIEELEEHLSHIPLIRTPRVERHIHYFQTSKRDHFDQWLARLNHYKPLIEKIFAQFQLPGDLVFLSLVESGFNPKAYSRARAAGPWQFMKATGKLYGLRVDEYVDERRDPIKSTVAAARYLRDLYDLFGTWPLAMAAYNAGERKIQRALRKAKAETFWEIAQTKFIRRETREYVPRFMAAAIIAKNPSQYGFEEVPADVHQFEEVVVSRPLHLRAIAAAADIPYEELHRLNPELRRDVTPPDDPAYHLKVPPGSRGAVEQALVSIKTWTPPVAIAKARKSRGGQTGFYRVQMGDSLGKIAKRFRVTIDELKTRNKLAGRSIKVGDVLLVGR